MSADTVNFEASYFELFEMPVSFQIERSLLDRRYRELQKVVHPDRYAAADDAEKRLAVQYAARINEAYETLKSPLLRADYLLALKGVEVGAETNTVMDPAFLMEQMELRDELSELASQPDPEAAVDSFRRGVSKSLRQYQNAFGDHLTEGSETSLNKAADLVRKMHFLEKLDAEAAALEERLLDY